MFLIPSDANAAEFTFSPSFAYFPTLISHFLCSHKINLHLKAQATLLTVRRNQSSIRFNKISSSSALKLCWGLLWKFKLKIKIVWSENQEKNDYWMRWKSEENPSFPIELAFEVCDDKISFSGYQIGNLVSSFMYVHSSLQIDFKNFVIYETSSMENFNLLSFDVAWYVVGGFHVYKAIKAIKRSKFSLNFPETFFIIISITDASKAPSHHPSFSWLFFSFECIIKKKLKNFSIRKTFSFVAS